jgi:hypothetical protein
MPQSSSLNGGKKTSVSAMSLGEISHAKGECVEAFQADANKDQDFSLGDEAASHGGGTRFPIWEGAFHSCRLALGRDLRTSRRIAKIVPTALAGFSFLTIMPKLAVSSVRGSRHLFLVEDWLCI